MFRMGQRNNFLKKQETAKQVCLDIGICCGRQQILDMLSLVLRDSEIMGKDTFGKERLLKVVQGINKYLGFYQKAWAKNDETDYYRAKLDDALADAYGEKLHDSFLVRYEFAPEFVYKKGKWK